MKLTDNQRVGKKKLKHMSSSKLILVIYTVTLDFGLNAIRVTTKCTRKISNVNHIFDALSVFY